MLERRVVSRTEGLIRRRALVRAALFLAVFLASGSSLAQFRNNGVIMPSVGYHGLGEQDIATQLIGQALEPVNQDVADTIKEFEWNSSPHLTIGAGYIRALGYNLWLVNEFAIGGGFAIKSTDQFYWPVFSIHASTGLRYNILDEEYRPYVCGYVHYIQLFSHPNAQIRQNEFFGLLDPGILGSFWVGARAGGGFEWFFMSSLRKWGIDVPIFYDEMSLQAEGSLAGFVNLAAPLVSGVARFSYLVYF